MAVSFHEDYYIKSKLAELATLGQSYTEDSLKAAIEKAGMTVQEHYNKYATKEGTSANPYFNTTEYLEAKLAQLNSIQEGGHSWTMQMLMNALEQAGLTAEEHYQKWGCKETDANGKLINPSNAFDANAYVAAKLAQLQATEPDAWSGKSAKDVLDAITKVGLNPVSHYEKYGAKEANDSDIAMVQTVPVVDRVANDPIRDMTGDNVPSNYNASTAAPASVTTGAEVTKPADMGGLASDEISPEVVNPEEPVATPSDPEYVEVPGNGIVDTNEQPVVLVEASVKDAAGNEVKVAQYGVETTEGNVQPVTDKGVVDASATPIQTSTTNSDGTTTTVTNVTDGENTISETTEQRDGGSTTTTEAELADGSTVKGTTETALGANGVETSTIAQTVTNPDGTTVETAATETKAGGTTTTESVVTAKDADGNVTGTTESKVVETANANGTTTAKTDATVKDADGKVVETISETATTAKASDGSTTTTTTGTSTDAAGNVTKTNTTVTENRDAATGATSTDTAAKTTNPDGSVVESQNTETVAKAADGATTTQSSGTTTTTDAQGNTSSVATEATKVENPDGSGTETTTTTATAADGSTVETTSQSETTVAEDGTKTTETKSEAVAKDAEGATTSTTTTAATTTENTDGTSTTESTAVTENADGTKEEVKTSETTNADGSSEKTTETTTTDADGKTETKTETETTDAEGNTDKEESSGSSDSGSGGGSSSSTTPEDTSFKVTMSEAGVLSFIGQYAGADGTLNVAVAADKATLTDGAGEKVASGDYTAAKGVTEIGGSATVTTMNINGTLGTALTVQQLGNTLTTIDMAGANAGTALTVKAATDSKVIVNNLGDQSSVINSQNKIITLNSDAGTTPYGDLAKGTFAVSGSTPVLSNGAEFEVKKADLAIDAASDADTQETITINVAAYTASVSLDSGDVLQYADGITSTETGSGASVTVLYADANGYEASGSGGTLQAGTLTAGEDGALSLSDGAQLVLGASVSYGDITMADGTSVSAPATVTWSTGSLKISDTSKGVLTSGDVTVSGDTFALSNETSNAFTITATSTKVADSVSGADTITIGDGTNALAYSGGLTVQTSGDTVGFATYATGTAEITFGSAGKGNLTAGAVQFVSGSEALDTLAISGSDVVKFELTSGDLNLKGSGSGSVFTITEDAYNGIVTLAGADADSGDSLILTNEMADGVKINSGDSVVLYKGSVKNTASNTLTLTASGGSTVTVKDDTAIVGSGANDYVVISDADHSGDVTLTGKATLDIDGSTETALGGGTLSGDATTKSILKISGMSGDTAGSVDIKDATVLNMLLTLSGEVDEDGAPTIQTVTMKAEQFSGFDALTDGENGVTGITMDAGDTIVLSTALKGATGAYEMKTALSGTLKLANDDEQKVQTVSGGETTIDASAVASGKAVSVTLTKGKDTITLGDANDTVVLDNFVDDDSITEFTAGASSDVLELSGLDGFKPAASDAFVSGGFDTVAATPMANGKIYVVSGVSGGDITAVLHVGAAADSESTTWDIETTSAVNAFVAAETATTGTYNLYHVSVAEGATELAADAVKLVGTVEATGAFVADNFTYTV